MKTKNLAVGALVGLLTLALWYNFLLKPSNAQAKKVKAETEIEKAKLPSLQAQLAQANNDAAHAGTFKVQLATLKNALPDSPALADFIRAANGIAAASNIEWQSVTHGPPTPGVGGVDSIPVGIQVQGTYEQVIDYLTRLASLRRLVVVDTLNVSTSGSTGAAGGAAGGPDASTGPFSGGPVLAVTIAARMFATPTDLALGTDGTATATAPVGGTSTPGGA